MYFARTADPLGPLGAKSMSEAPFNPVAPALANAVRDATGVRITGLPMSPDRVYLALNHDRPPTNLTQKGVPPMVQLGANRYGKAEVRVMRVARGAGPGGGDVIRDWNVSTSLSGDLAATHLTGDNSAVLATDTQKNTVYAFAQRLGPVPPETFGMELAAYFVAQPAADHPGPGARSRSTAGPGSGPSGPLVRPDRRADPG